MKITKRTINQIFIERFFAGLPTMSEKETAKIAVSRFPGSPVSQYVYNLIKD